MVESDADHKAHCRAIGRRATCEPVVIARGRTRRRQRSPDHSAPRLPGRSRDGELERLRDFAELGADWLWETDADHRVRFVSANIRSAGIEPAQVLGQRRVDARIDDPIDDDWAEHLRALSERRAFKDFTYAYRDQQGRRRIARTSGRPLYDPNGRFLGFRGVAREVTAELEMLAKLRDSERRFRSLVGNMRGIIFCHGSAGSDAHGYDEGGARIYGADAAEIAGTVDSEGRARIGTWYDAVHPDDRAAYAEAERRRKERHGPYALTYRIHHPVHGGLRWMHEVAWVWTDDVDGRIFFDSYILDVTAGKTTEIALAQSRERHRHLVDRAPIAILIIVGGVCRYANTAASKLLGSSRVALDGRRVNALFADPGLCSILARGYDGDRPVSFAARPSLVRRGERGCGRVEISGVAFEEDGSSAWQVVIADLEARERVETLRHRALHDGLTGLPNRQHLEERLRAALGRARPGNVAAIVLDLDGFKAINDSFGHATGDALLRAVAGRLKAALRAVDSLGRLGGDEFAVVLERIRGRGQVEAMCARLLNAFATPFVVEGAEVVVGASLGVAWSRPGAGHDGSLLRHADLALGRAKRAGRGRVCFYEPALDIPRVRSDLERDLRRAAPDELWLDYQPQIDLGSRRVVGVEALLRWRSPSRGLVPPAEFIPIAEATGLIRDLGARVLDEACAQARRWRDEGRRLPVWVNVAAAQLRHADFVSQMERLLQRYALPAELIGLDVPEPALSRANEDGLAEVLDRLAALGVRLAVDDFGTGHASLVVLERLPFEGLKLDRSLIRGLGQDAERESLVRVALAVAHSLGRLVIAEGVESELQNRWLLDAGCDRAQGFAFARPAAPALVPSAL